MFRDWQPSLSSSTNQQSRHDCNSSMFTPILLPWSKNRSRRPHMVDLGLKVTPLKSPSKCWLENPLRLVWRSGDDVGPASPSLNRLCELPTMPGAAIKLDCVALYPKASNKRESNLFTTSCSELANRQVKRVRTATTRAIWLCQSDSRLALGLSVFL